ncbi:hypothetical protein [Jatrophihabitans sp.]|uniref:hypothetical protein n=1 Tax=Jatrophihabitans sp. TaxID=1932789 RepID=UPI0030C6DFAE|nr:conserved hypothetical rane protein [Jatrophihabitans sp.]
MTAVLEPSSSTEVGVTTTAEPAAEVRAPLPFAVRFTARWVALAAALAVIFFPTWRTVAHEIGGHSPIGYLIAVPFWVALTALGSRRRRTVGLPIHDAETDGIVGGGMLAIGFVGQRLIGPRLNSLYDLWHADLFAVWLAAFGFAVLLVGLRPVGRFRGAWGVAFLVWPLPYRIVGVLLGGTPHAFGWIDAAITAAVLASLSRSRRVGGLTFLAAVLIGGATAQLVPGPLLVVQLVPVITAALAGLLVLAVGDRGGEAPVPNPKPAVSAVSRQRWLVLVLVTAGAFFALPRPPATPALRSVSAAASSQAKLAAKHAWQAPLGWHVVSSAPSTWVDAYYGSDATWERQKVVADKGRAAWDKFSRPRTIMIDTLTVDGAQQLRDFPVITTYPIAGDRTREPVNVNLGHGITGQLYDTVDDTHALTFTMLTITWTVPTSHGPKAQRVTLISTDDHRSTAIFPQPEPSLSQSVRASVKRVLRGDATTRDTNVAPKDAAMLVSAGTSLVAAVVGGA